MATGKRSSERALQKVLGKGANVNADNPLEVHDPKVGSLISYEGTTTADGADDGSSLIDTVLASKPDYNGNLVIITSGAYAGQGRDINGVTTGGTVTPSSAFGGQILRGTNFQIWGLRLTPAEVAAIDAKLGAFTAAQNLKAILGNLTTTKNLGGILGTLTTTDNLKAILGAYTAAANLKAAIDTIDTAITAIKAVTDVIPDAGALTALIADITAIKAITDAIPDSGALTALIADITAILADTGELQTDWADGGRLDLLLDAIKAVTDALPDAGALNDLAAILEDTGTTIPGLLAAIAGYIDTEVAAIKAQTDKLAGAAPVVGTATENWNTAENDIVSIGANDTKNKLHSLVLNISALTATATITIRMYMQVNGVERKVYDQDFIKGTDPDGLWIVNGTVGIHEVLRVTAQSDNAGDDGKAIGYDYMLEAM